MQRPVNDLKNRALTPGPFPKKNGEGEQEKSLIEDVILSP